MDEKNFTPATASEKFLKHMEKKGIEASIFYEDDLDNEIYHTYLILSKCNDSYLLYNVENQNITWTKIIDTEGMVKGYKLQDVFDAMPEWAKCIVRYRLLCEDGRFDIKYKPHILAIHEIMKAHWNDGFLSIFYNTLEYLLEKGLEDK